jgi:hypothetical protein
MKIVDYVLRFKGDSQTLVQTGDWHDGNDSQDNDAIECVIDRIKSRSLPWVDMGDAIEAILPGDKRYTIVEKSSTMLDQINTAIIRRQPIAKTCIGTIESNHEAAASKLVGNITEQIAHESKITNLTQTCFLRLHCPKGICTMFLTHYIPSINNRNEDALVRKSAKASRLRKILRPFEADAKMAAHIHNFICHTPTSEDRLMVDDASVLKHRPVLVYPSWCVVSPSMVKTYGERGYGQARLCDPSDIGWAEWTIRRDGKILQVANVLGDGKTKKTYVPELVD